VKTSYLEKKHIENIHHLLQTYNLRIDDIPGKSLRLTDVEQFFSNASEQSFIVFTKSVLSGYVTYIPDKIIPGALRCEWKVISDNLIRDILNSAHKHHKNDLVTMHLSGSVYKNIKNHLTDFSVSYVLDNYYYLDGHYENLIILKRS